MAAMSNITVADSATSTFTWASKTPAGNDLPARWAASIFGATSRVGDAKLAYKYKRNQADTADRFDVNIMLPETCNGGVSCSPEQVVGKATCSLTLTIPDTLQTTDRAVAVELILNTLSSSEFKAAMKAGESFY